LDTAREAFASWPPAFIVGNRRIIDLDDRDYIFSITALPARSGMVKADL
jgi:hypothetical protein